MQSLLRRRLVWVTVALLLSAIAAICFLISRPNRISQTNCDKIQIGWTLDQVEELLGEGRPIAGIPIAGLWYWGDVVGDTIIVEFDGNKTVITKQLLPDNLTPGQRIYRRTRLSVREAVKLPPEP